MVCASCLIAAEQLGAAIKRRLEARAATLLMKGPELPSGAWIARDHDQLSLAAIYMRLGVHPFQAFRPFCKTLSRRIPQCCSFGYDHPLAASRGGNRIISVLVPMYTETRPAEACEVWLEAEIRQSTDKRG